jgi:hypothetical protein
MISPVCIAGEYEEAAQKAGEAFYVQSGLNSIVDNNVREIQEKLPPYCKKTLDVIVPIVDIIVKQRIELKYEF